MILKGLWNAWLMLTGLDDIQAKANWYNWLIQFHAVMINASAAVAVKQVGVRGVALMIEDWVLPGSSEDICHGRICAAVESRGQQSLRMYLSKAAAARLMDAVVNKELCLFSRSKEASQ